MHRNVMKRWAPWLNKILLLEKHHQDSLWRALNNDIVDIIASDHAPHTLDEKSKIIQTHQVELPVFKL